MDSVNHLFGCNAPNVYVANNCIGKFGFVIFIILLFSLNTVVCTHTFTVIILCLSLST